MRRKHFILYSNIRTVYFDNDTFQMKRAIFKTQMGKTCQEREVYGLPRPLYRFEEKKFGFLSYISDLLPEKNILSYNYRNTRNIVPFDTPTSRF